MTNLRYVNLLMDAFDGAFYEGNILSDIELHYITQCFEGEEISVRKKSCDDGYIVMCVHSDGSVAAAAFMKFTRRKE